MIRDIRYEKSREKFPGFGISMARLWRFERQTLGSGGRYSIR